MDTKSEGFSLFSKSMQARILVEQGEQVPVEEIKPQAEQETKPENEQPEVKPLSEWEEYLDSQGDNFANEVRMRASDFPRRRRRGLNW